MKETQHATQNPPKEKRQYYRITDTIYLQYEAGQKEQASEHDIDSEAFDHLSNLQQAYFALDQKSQSLFESMKGESSAITEVLQLLDDKINLVLHALIATDTDKKQFTKTCVNLSATGLAFPSDTAIEPQTALRLTLTLLPSYATISCVAVTVACRKGNDQEKPYEIAVEFSKIDHDDRETIIRHIIKQESKALTAKRVNTAQGITQS